MNELEKALRELRDEMGGKEGNIVASALRKAGKDTVLASMKSKAAQHVETGKLLESLSIRKHPNPRKWSELYGVGVHKMGKRPKRGEQAQTPWYAKVVEYGGHGKSGPLKGFMRSSLEENQERMVNQFKRDAGAKIERAAKKIGNKNLAAVGARIRQS